MNNSEEKAPHTPGPWRWEDGYDSGDCLEHKKLGLDADCENIREGRIVLLGSDGETVLAAWADWAGDQGLTVSREDARLIAAAPELVEALEAIIDSANDGRTIPEWLSERLRLAYSAVRKAKGDTQVNNLEREEMPLQRAIEFEREHRIQGGDQPDWDIHHILKFSESEVIRALKDAAKRVCRECEEMVQREANWHLSRVDGLPLNQCRAVSIHAQIAVLESPKAELKNAAEREVKK